MTMQEALNKANEGGYMKEWTLILHPSGFVYVTPKEDETPGMSNKSLPDILLDAEFWKAFVSALAKDHKGIPVEGGWQRMWHEFIDHLITGGTIEEYFANL